MSTVPFMCVAAFTVVLLYPVPWHRLHAYSECSRCSPESGGEPWQRLQPVACEAVERPQLSHPWQPIADEQVRVDAFQPETVTSWRAFRWSVGLAVVGVYPAWHRSQLIPSCRCS